jgi:NitT/TauT family transport system substrate-binding protein
VIALKRTPNVLKISFMLIMIIALAAVQFTGCDKEELTKIRLNEVVRSIFYAPQYVAIHKGFFKDQGLDIELATGQGADKTMTALLSGQADIGFAGPESAIYVLNEGKEDYAVVFSQLTQRDGSFMVARRHETSFSWEQLKGKTIIGGRPGGVPEMTLEYVLKQHGIDPARDVELITNLQFTATAGAFAGGTGDYVALFEPTASALEKEGTGKVVASIGQESGLIPYTAYFTTKNYMEKNPEILQRFTNAVYKGQLWVKEHSSQEIAKEVISFFPDTDEQLLVTVIDRYKEIGAWNETPVMTEDSLGLLQKVMKSAGYLDKEADFKKLVNNTFAQKAVDTVK